jgi:transposase
VNYVLKLYDISRRTLFSWLKREKEGILENSNKNSGNKPKIKQEQIEQLLKKENLTLKEMADELKVGITTVFNYLKKHNITFKKNSLATEKVIQ